MAVGCPAAEDDSVDAQRRDRQREQNSDVEVADKEMLRERDDGKGGKGGDDADDRSNQKHRLVRFGGNDVFLEQELDRIGNRLQQAPGANAHGPQPGLHERQDLPLHVHQEGDHS